MSAIAAIRARPRRAGRTIIHRAAVDGTGAVGHHDARLASSTGSWTMTDDVKLDQRIKDEELSDEGLDRAERQRPCVYSRRTVRDED